MKRGSVHSKRGRPPIGGRTVVLVDLRTVIVLGAGTIGTSIGLALTRSGVRVRLADPTPTRSPPR
jgi:phosphoglycerate dehydrogenase-like enzyme